MASGPITSWEIDGETVSDFIFGGAPKSLQMVTAAMKLKDACSLEGTTSQPAGVQVLSEVGGRMGVLLESLQGQRDLIEACVQDLTQD